MSTVRIPPTLRTSTGGAKQVEVPGSTVREVVSGLVAAYPALGSQLLAADGDLVAADRLAALAENGGW